MGHAEGEEQMRRPENAGIFARLLGVTLAGGLLAGCGEVSMLADSETASPTLTPISRIGAHLELLPPAVRQVDVAVYSYEDKTGQQRPNDNFADFSNAVTQGGEAVLIDVLMDVGDGKWFNVVERAGLQNLLTEREIIDQTNANYRGSEESELPPLRFAGTIIEGGVIDYDSNVVTGGIGARILGVGANKEYRRDRISVALRAVSVSTGEVLASVSTDKTVYSVLQQASVFRYVSSDEILELETGYTQNEPKGLALRKAIELAVYALVIEGAEEGLWSFADRAYQHRLVRTYNAAKDRVAGSPEAIVAAERARALENSGTNGNVAATSG